MENDTIDSNMVGNAGPQRKKFLSISDIKAAKDEEYAEVEAWDGAFLAGSLTAEDFIEWQEANEGPAKRNAGLRLIVKSICDNLEGCPVCDGVEDGTDAKHRGVHPRIGNDKHLEVFKEKSVAQTEKVVAAIVKLNKLKASKDDAPKNG